MGLVLVDETEAKRLYPQFEGKPECWAEVAKLFYKSQGVTRQKIPFCIAPDVDGWELFYRVREMCEKEKKVYLILAQNSKLQVRYVGEQAHEVIDLARMLRGAKMQYWFEIDKKGSGPIIWSLGSEFLLVKMVDMDSKRAVDVFLECKKEGHDELIKRLREADYIEIEGMLIDASRATKSARDVQFVATKPPVCKFETFEGADCVLRNLKKWDEIYPMRHVETGLPLFSLMTGLSMYHAAVWTVPDDPSANNIYMGKSGDGKSVMAVYFTENIMKGMKESASGSAGKGWNPSHKEGAEESKFFKEQNMFLVNEMSKYVSVAMVHDTSLATAFKILYQRQMEILERTEFNASSGNGTVRGVMKCGFIATDNPDENVIRATGRAYMMAEAWKRRVNFCVAEREGVQDVDSDASTSASIYKYMGALFSRFAGEGRSGEDNIRSLVLFSRRMALASGKAGVGASKEWRKKVRQMLVDEAKMGVPGYPDWLTNPQYEQDRPRLAGVIENLSVLMRKRINACYVFAAIVRGWEVYDSIRELQPVIDERQEQMAIELARYYMVCDLKYLRSGIEQSGGIQRTNADGYQV